MRGAAGPNAYAFYGIACRFIGDLSADDRAGREVEGAERQITRLRQCHIDRVGMRESLGRVHNNPELALPQVA